MARERSKSVHDSIPKQRSNHAREAANGTGERDSLPQSSDASVRTRDEDAGRNARVTDDRATRA